MTIAANTVTLEKRSDHFLGRFAAMASPCEILVDSLDKGIARRASELAATEALRIEHKFSRYRDDNAVYRINQGEQVELDKESAELIEFANTLYELSDGMFDITSGILRKAWRFDGGEHVPDSASIAQLLPNIGWQKVDWQNPLISLPSGMQIDLGGIGKEYAVDRCAQILSQQCEQPCLINFGGDLTVTGPRLNNRAWQVGIESANDPGQSSGSVLALKRGALATSGDVRRYVIKDGVRYGHILNPKTGWPVAHAPRSVTVVSNTCTQAGMLATLGMLQGANCESYLRDEGVQFWCIS